MTPSRKFKGWFLFVGTGFFFGVVLALFCRLAFAAAAAGVPTPPAWAQYLLLGWPVLTGLASLGYTAADKTRRGHAALSFLAASGLDLPKMLDAVRRLLPTGGSGPGGSAGGDSVSVAVKELNMLKAAEIKIPPTSKTVRGLHVVMTGLAVCVGCALIPLSMGVAVSSCTKAESVEVQDIIGTVLRDDLAGDTLAQMTADVASILCGTPDAGATCTVGTVVIDVEAVLEDALAFLVHSGTLANNPDAFARARAFHAEVSAHLAARKAQ